MSSELIKNPTPKTHPTILTECQPSLIMSQLFEADSDSTTRTEDYHSTTPRDFSTLMKLKEHHDQSCNSVNRDELGGKNKLLNKIKEWREVGREAVIFYLAIGITFFVPVGILCGPVLLVDRYDNPVFFLLIPALTIVFTCGLHKYNSSNSKDKNPSSNSKDKNPLKKYTLIRVEKPLLETLFLDNEKHKFYAPEPVTMYQINHKLITKLSEIFSTDSSILQSIDFYEFSVLYDSYMDMLVFLLTNKHALSSELRDEYIENLYKKSIALEHEADAILKVIDIQKEFKLKAAYESEQLRQEIIDSEARSFMPLDD